MRIPGLFCVRGIFKIFDGNFFRICQLYCCFHQSICSKTRQKDLRNCPQHPKRDLSKGDTVWWALQNCMFLGGQRDIKTWACVWSRVVQICGVLPCLFLRVNRDAARGLQCLPERDLQNMDGEKIDWQHILLNHDDQLFRIFPIVTTGTRRREHGVYWFLSSVYWFPICDGRNCELLNSMMTQICSRNRPHRVVKWKMSSYELNPPNKRV